MGCDIHMVREEKVNGKWLGASICDIDRSYLYFGALAGVCKDDVAHHPPRGVPEDASGTYKDLVEYWGVDGHSHSYLSPKEMEDALNECEKHITGFTLPMGAPNPEWDKGSEVRYCFFFDN